MAANVIAGKAAVLITAVDLTDQVLRRVEKKVGNMGKRLQATGRSMFFAGAGGLLPFGFSLKTFSEFDAAMRRVVARSEEAKGTMSEFEQHIKSSGEFVRQIAREIPAATALNVAEASEVLAQQFGSLGDVRQALKPTLELAIAGGRGRTTDPETAALSISKMLKAYRMEAGQSSRVADALTVAVNNSAFTLTDLSDAFKQAAPLARQMNLKMEEMVATTMLFRNIVPSETAGIAMKNFFTRAAQPQNIEAVNKELLSFGKNAIQVADEAGNLRKPMEILQDLGREIQGIGTLGQARILENLFGLRAISPATAATSTEAFAQFNKVLGEFRKGVASQTASQIASGLDAELQRLNTSFTDLKIVIGEIVENAFGFMVPKVRAFLDDIQKWAQMNQGLVATLATIAVTLVSLGAATIVIGAGLQVISFALGGITTALFAVKVLILAISGAAQLLWANPIGLAIAAGLAAAVTSLMLINVVMTRIMGTGEQVTGMFESMGRNFQHMMTAIGEGRLVEAFQIMINGMKILWLQFLNWASRTWSENLVSIVRGFFAPFRMFQSELLELQRTMDLMYRSRELDIIRLQRETDKLGEPRELGTGIPSAGDAIRPSPPSVPAAIPEIPVSISTMAPTASRAFERGSLEAAMENWDMVQQVKTEQMISEMQKFNKKMDESNRLSKLTKQQLENMALSMVAVP